MRIWTPTLALCLGLLLGSCTPGARSRVSQAFVSDSSGVPRVEVTGLRGLRAPDWTLEESFRASAAGEALYRVTAARLLRSGALAIANSGDHEVLLLGPTGRLLRKVGRDGEGPGEFKAITSLNESADGFVTYDADLGRLSSFDSAGEFLASRPLEPPAQFVDLLPLVMTPTGSGLAVYGSQRTRPGEGIRQHTTPLLRYAGTGASPDTIGLWGADEQSYTTLPTGGWISIPVGFGRHLAASGRSGRAVLGSTDSLNATVFDSSGVALLRLIGLYVDAPVPDSALKAWKAEATSHLSDRVPQPFRKALRLAPHEDTYPAFDKLLVDGDGDVWVGSTAAWGDSERTWIVFGPEGHPVGSSTLPKGVDLLDVAYGRAVGRVHDSKGVVDLLVYQVRHHG